MRVNMKLSDLDWNYTQAFEQYNLGGLTASSVARVCGAHGVSTDGYAQIDVWMWGQLLDGRYFYLVGGCDTTGWDRQSWGTIYFARNPGELRRTCMDRTARQVFGLLYKHEV